MQVITVTSNLDNPADFTSAFTNAVQLSNEDEVGLLSISHAPACNITEYNNKLYVKDSEHHRLTRIVIPEGYYETSFQLLKIFYGALNEHPDPHDPNEDDRVDTRANLKYRNSSIMNEIMVLELTNKNSRFDDVDFPDNILKFLNCVIPDTSVRSLSLNDFHLPSPIQMGFIYSTIVSNSLINDRSSPLLATVPIVSPSDEYCTYEIINPVFHDISTFNFIDISFEIRDINANIINLAMGKPTILTIAIRKKDNY